MYTFHYPVIQEKETGKRLKEIRKSKKLRVPEVCEYLGGISEQAVYKWERGACLPTIDNLLALSCLYHVQMEDMLVTTEVEMASSFFGKNRKIVVEWYEITVKDLTEYEKIGSIFSTDSRYSLGNDWCVCQKIKSDWIELTGYCYHSCYHNDSVIILISLLL